MSTCNYGNHSVAIEKARLFIGKPESFISPSRNTPDATDWLTSKSLSIKDINKYPGRAPKLSREDANIADQTATNFTELEKELARIEMEEEIIESLAKSERKRKKF